MRLHSIALRSVFDQVMPLVELIDPSSRQGPNSPWCHYLRTWKALALVCHEWHHIAIPYLYHDIALCHVGQIPALARTLKKNAEFCGMIKPLTYSCFVPAEYDLVANQGLSYLLDHCSVLESLTFTSPFTEWIDGIREDGTKRFIIPEGPWGSVTHFTYNRGDPAVLVNRGQHKPSILPRQILTCLPNITSLTLIVNSPEKCEWDEKLLELTMMHLQQVCVQSFSCYIAFRKKFDPTKNGIRIEEALYPLVNGHALLLRPTATSIGSLQHVVIRRRYPSFDLNKFLSAFQGHIDLWEDTHRFAHIQSALRVRPLIQDYHDEGEWDYFRSMARPGDEYAHLRYGHKVREYYPHPRVRLIDDALIGYPSVSFIFPPGEIEENDESIYVYHGFGSCVIVTAHMIVRHEDWSWVGRNVMHQDITEEEEQNDDRNALLPFYQVTCINDDVAAKYHGLTWSDELFSDWDLWGGTHSSSIHTNCPDTEPTESDTSPSEDDDEGDLVQEAAWLEEEFEEDAVVQLTEEEALQIFEDMQW